MLKANIFSSPGFKSGWEITGSAAMTAGVLIVTIKDGNYTNKISGISHTLNKVVGNVKVTKSTSGNDTLLTFEAFEVDGETPLDDELLDFAFFISNEVNPTDSSMLVHDLDIQIS